MIRGSGLARVPSGARRGESGYGVDSGIGLGVNGLKKCSRKLLRVVRYSSAWRTDSCQGAFRKDLYLWSSGRV